MSKVVISGIGLISVLGTNIDAVWENMNNSFINKIDENEIEFEAVLKKNKLRRANRYSHMGLYASIKAKEDAGLDLESIDEYRIGTIFSTGYGPLVSNLEFTKSVVQGDPDLCSPTLFANTVSNSCIGHICMNMGCKGVSTIIMGSNNIGYSKNLILKDKADYIITGSVEEYCEDLYTAFSKNDISSKTEIREGTVAFVLQKEDLVHDINNIYCHVNSHKECDLGGYPLNTIVNKDEVTRLVGKSIRECIDKDRISVDAVFTSANNTYFDDIEDEIVKEVLPEVINVRNMKKHIGDTLGSSFNMNVMAAALCLKNNYIPKDVADSSEDIKDIKNILVTGYDVSGNYICMILSK